MLEKTKKKPTLLLTLGVAGVLVVGGGVAYWLLAQRQAGPEDLPIGVEVVPQDVLMTLSVTTDPGQWRTVRTFGTEKSQAALDQNLVQLRDRVLTANGLDYQKDIQPWVGGEVTMAFLPAAAPTTPPPASGALPNPNQQSVIVVLPIRDALRAKQILEQPRPQTAQLTNRAYKGVQIKETKPNAPQTFSVAALDGKFIVVSNDAKSMDRAIDTYQGGAALDKTPGYKQALGQIKATQPFSKLYVNLPAAAAMSAASSGRTLAPEAQQNQGLAATVTLESEGVLFRSVSWLKPDSQRRFEARNTAKLMPSRLPAGTMMMASGGSLRRFWNDYKEGAKSSPVPLFPPETLQKGIQETVGMNWENDFLPWMDSEFGLSLVSASDGAPPNLPFSILMTVQASDRRAAEKTLKQLDEAMTNKYKVKVEEAQVAGKTVVNWTFPVGGPLVTRGWLDNDVAFLSLGAPIAESIVPRPANALADSQPFKQGIPTGLNPNNGHFFINMDQALNSKSMPLLQLPPATRDVVSAMRSIGVTAAVTSDRTSRYDVFVALQKGPAPQPLASPTVPPSPSPSASPTP